MLAARSVVTLLEVDGDVLAEVFTDELPKAALIGTMCVPSPIGSIVALNAWPSTVPAT